MFKLILIGVYLSPIFKPTEIKVEGYIYIRNDGGYICFGHGATVYLTVPKTIVQFLKKKFSIDLYKRPKEFDVTCTLLEENGRPKLLFTFNPKPLEILEEVKGK